MEKVQSFLSQSHFLITARAATAIYLVLYAKAIRHRAVLVPANLCYAGIYPILYTDNQPVFCDVDAVTGNMTLVSYLAAVTPEVAAVIVPHMYGNPVKDLPAIAAHCHAHGILLIEDCASAMGAEAEDYELGHIGDYTVYSTGYSKTLEIGFGGILCSHHDLSEMVSQELLLPPFGKDDEQNLALFSKLYRLLRNEGGGAPLERMIYDGLPNVCRNAFVHRLPQEKKEMIRRRLTELPEIIRIRRKAQAHYEHLLRATHYHLYPYQQGAVPWRFNLLVEPSLKKKLIEISLRRNLPVSDWYPRVTPMFACSDSFPGAEQHEKQILNYPLLLPNEQINSICETLLQMEVQA